MNDICICIMSLWVKSGIGRVTETRGKLFTNSLNNGAHRNAALGSCGQRLRTEKCV